MLTLPAGARAVGPPLALGPAPYPTPSGSPPPRSSRFAAANGVPASLAAAIGWQESGFNNDLVSSATRARDADPAEDVADRALASTPARRLAPASAAHNVRARAGCCARC